MHLSKSYSVDVGGKTLTAEFSDLAEQSNGSVLIRYGNTVVLVTAVMSPAVREGADFFPLTVDYEERFYAAGQILGSRFVRREGRPTDEAILSGRIVDRAIRPLFPRHLRIDVQVVVTVLSIDEDDPDILGVIGASLALGTSDIPWNGTVSAVRIGKPRGAQTFIINPTYSSRKTPDFEGDLTVCGKNGKINMIEAGTRELPEGIILKGFEEALKDIARLEDFQERIISEIGKTKRIMEVAVIPEALKKLFATAISPKLDEYVFSGPGQSKRIDEFRKEWLALVGKQLPAVLGSLASEYYEEAISELVHREAIDRRRRPDGRRLDELRPLFAKAGGISPVLHGSGIFYRGGTHILTTLTLGSPRDALLIDSIEAEEKKRFMHHYNFPPFSSGETGRIGATNRRMIGHGALAEKALLPVIPAQEKFPYTIRLVSETLASNGSTSMGSVCASTLALLDGGVPISSPVAGIAIGLMIREKKMGNGSEYEYKVLTDIQGPEDHHGDMDFKVAGTKRGVTAIQMDVKIPGISIPILAETLEYGRRARFEILEVIERELRAPRPTLKPSAPRVMILKINPNQIGSVIGTGGKTIREIMEKSGAEIDIENDGAIYITGKGESAERAKKLIEGMTREYLKGEHFTGTVTRVVDFGAFIRINGNAEGLVHISEIAPFRIEKVTDLLREGDEVPVIIKDIDEKKHLSLSIRQADPDFAKKRMKIGKP